MSIEDGIIRTWDPGDFASLRTVFTFVDKSCRFTIEAPPGGEGSRFYPLVLSRTAAWYRYTRRRKPDFVNEPFFTEPRPR